MKVILSVEPIKYPMTGIGRYTYELAHAIQHENAVDELVFFSGSKIITSIPGCDPTPTASHYLKNAIKNNKLVIKTYQYLSPLKKKYALSSFKDYVYHGPNYFLPPFSGGKVATFHDLSPFKHPDFFEKKLAIYTQEEMEKGLRKSDRIITVSHFIKKELSDFFSYDSDKIDVTPLAASPDFRPRTLAETQGVLKKYGIEYNSYSLFVGTIEPRKNLINLMAAYRLLPQKLRQAYPLVISGFKGWRNEDIFSSIEKGQREGWVIYLGYTPADHIPVLFSAARIFCFPSHYEGFGLPVLEALQSGVPVVCADNSSLPEVAGEGAFFHNAQDCEQLQRQIESALIDEERRRFSINSGIAHASTFSWKSCARKTIDVYKKLY